MTILPYAILSDCILESQYFRIAALNLFYLITCEILTPTIVCELELSLVSREALSLVYILALRKTRVSRSPILFHYHENPWARITYNYLARSWKSDDKLSEERTPRSLRPLRCSRNAESRPRRVSASFIRKLRFCKSTSHCRAWCSRGELVWTISLLVTSIFVLLRLHDALLHQPQTALYVQALFLRPCSNIGIKCICRCERDGVSGGI